MTAPARPDLPLTYGQLSVWRIMESYPAQRWPETYLRSVVRVPPGRTLAEVRAALGTVCRRHESLRTYFLPGSDGPVQRVMPAADPEPVIVEHRGTADDAAADALADSLAQVRIDRAHQFGRRFAILTVDGRPGYVAVVVDHIVADGFGLRRLGAELAAALGADDADGRRWLAEMPPQPADLAVHQRSEAGAARRTAALDQWRHLMRSLPVELFPVPRTAGDTPGRIEAILHSRRARADLATLGTRTAVTASSVLLALTALAVATVTGHDRVVLTLQSSNRFAPPWRSIVSSMNQYAPLTLTCSPRTQSFGGFAATAHTAALKAYRTGSYDFDAVTELVAEERGIDLGFDHFFNFMAHDVRVPPAAGDESTRPGWVQETVPYRQIGPRLDVKVREGAEMPIVIRADPTMVPREPLRALAEWYDEQLHRLAADPDITIGDLLGSCGRATGRLMPA